MPLRGSGRIVPETGQPGEGRPSRRGAGERGRPGLVPGRNGLAGACPHGAVPEIEERHIGLPSRRSEELDVEAPGVGPGHDLIGDAGDERFRRGDRVDLDEPEAEGIQLDRERPAEDGPIARPLHQHLPRMALPHGQGRAGRGREADRGVEGDRLDRRLPGHVAYEHDRRSPVRVGDVPARQRMRVLEQGLEPLVELDQPGEPRIILVAEEEKRSVHLGREHRSPSEGLRHQVVLPPFKAAVEADAVVLELPEGRPIEF